MRGGVGLDGPLACERLVDVLQKMVDGRSELPGPGIGDRIKGLYAAKKRSLKKRLRSYRSHSHLKPDFQQHRFPGISLEEMRLRIGRFQKLLGYSEELKVEQVFDQIYCINN